MPDKKNKNLIPRPPVVVVLGHVDHGKSSILEAIKDLKITAKESGGITQHIGAYELEHQGKKIAFIDTPGHEAFSAMRSRGAKVADIAILVVAADEGVKPQTKEAILHIKKSEIPLIVAINKMDKSEADPAKVKRELSSQDILVESMGGKIPSVEVSAKTKKGINELLEMILLVAEVEKLETDIEKPAKGTVIEAYMDSNRGPTATLILSEGAVKRGDILGTESAYGKVKILEDFQGKIVDQALPSIPVVILGFENVPGVGEQFKIFLDIESAKKEIKETPKIGREAIVAETDKKTLNLILKVDVQGSLEAVEKVLGDISQEKANIKILKAEVGDINENDVKMAKGAKARILSFRVKTNPIAKGLALREKITILTFDIIYELAQTARQLLEKKIEPESIRTDLGKIKILEVFRQEKSRQIIGGKVTDGLIKKGGFAEITRNKEKIGKGKIIGLQKQKKEIDEALKGSECGLLYEGTGKIEKGDILEIYTEERRKREL